MVLPVLRRPIGRPFSLSRTEFDGDPAMPRQQLPRDGSAYWGSWQFSDYFNSAMRVFWQQMLGGGAKFCSSTEEYSIQCRSLISQL